MRCKRKEERSTLSPIENPDGSNASIGNRFGVFGFW